MPRLLVAGCGYVGTAAAHLFLEAGWEVTGWTRHVAEPLADGIKRVAVDLRDEGAVRAHVVEVDAVVHCASSGGEGASAYEAVYRVGANNLARAFPLVRLLFTSSTSVYGQRGGEWVDENSVAEPVNDTGKILRAAEGVVLEHGGVVLRLGGIYGPGRSALLRAVRAGTAWLSGEERFVNQVHRDDIASAIFLVTQSADLPTPRIFNVVDNAPVLRGEIVRWLAERVPLAPSSKSHPLATRRRSFSNKRVSNARLRALGWTPRFPTYQEGLTHCLLQSAV